MHWSGWWMFKAHLQTGIVFPLPCPPLTLTTYMLKSRWGAHLQGVQFMVTNSSSPSHKLAGALGSSSSSSLSGHPGSIVWSHRDGCKVPKQSGRNTEPLPLPKSNLPPSQVRKETDSAGGREHVPGVIMLITDVLFLSGRGVQSKVFAGSSLECRLNLEVLGHLHRAWSPHVNLLRAVATSTYDLLFLGGGQGMSWSGLLASYAVPSMVFIQTVCTS